MITILSIAGYDPSGGAGILADIKTFSAFGCYGVAAITSLTFQNTVTVEGASHQGPDVLASQLRPLVDDFSIAAVKTGMLPTPETIEVAAGAIREFRLPNVVVDPVVRSTSGFDLIDDRALRELVRLLLPLARVITPNLAEAERLTGLKVDNLPTMKEAAHRLFDLCVGGQSAAAPAVLIKGGHLTETATDLLYDGRQFHSFHGERIATRNTHGTGCTLSAAISARLGAGATLIEAIGEAKRYVERAIRTAPGLGSGAGPLNHSVAPAPPATGV
ncbi:MAG: bifunctional hydroxymethylpyrimidine kinase/phosphomethylpyrimidine kinase [Acidobacteria bacterium]|nr:bifunctional hydroxymethylpyrimidine kinase/phosphomethylpyrimidine kinase [Acidobacteriota bacterium]